MTDQLLQLLWVPGCFFGSGLLGLRLGTPRPVATGLLAVGITHSLAFLGAQQSIDSSGTSAAWVHLASQCLFAAGFAALVWQAAAYPARRPSTLLMALVGALALLGPAIGAVSGPTPTVVQLDDDTVQRGPIVHLLPADVASVAVAPVLLLPVVAVVLFAVRYHRADLRVRQRAPTRTCDRGNASNHLQHRAFDRPPRRRRHRGCRPAGRWPARAARPCRSCRWPGRRPL